MLDEGKGERAQRVGPDASGDIDTVHLRSEGSGQGSQRKLGHLTHLGMLLITTKSDLQTRRTPRSEWSADGARQAS